MVYRHPSPSSHGWSTTMTLVHEPRHGAASPAGSAAVADAMARAARGWVDALTAAQRRAALWPFLTPERGDWHYAPRSRNGLALKDMDERQRGAAHVLLASALSPAGVAK